MSFVKKGLFKDSPEKISLFEALEKMERNKFDESILYTLMQKEESLFKALEGLDKKGGYFLDFAPATPLRLMPGIEQFKKFNGLDVGRKMDGYIYSTYNGFFGNEKSMRHLSKEGGEPYFMVGIKLVPLKDIIVPEDLKTEETFQEVHGFFQKQGLSVMNYVQATAVSMVSDFPSGNMWLAFGTSWDGYDFPFLYDASGNWRSTVGIQTTGFSVEEDSSLLPYRGERLEAYIPVFEKIV
jgi:hypothetical protein